MNKRYFTPDINSWKYINQPPKNKKVLRKNNKRFSISEKNLDSIVDNSTNMMDFAVSFTKTVVRICFILFVVVNVFIMTMTGIAFFMTNELSYIDTLITECYGMLRDVIAAYIIKAGTENALRIGFSVLSDYVDKKYNIKTDPNTEYDDYDDPEYYDDNIESIDNTEPIIEDDDPIGEEGTMDGGIDIIR